MPVQSPTEKRTILRQLIDERGLKYVFVADKVGITPSALTRVMNGDRPLTANEMLAFENVLGVSHDAFFDGRDLRFCSEQASSPSTNAGPSPASTTGVGAALTTEGSAGE